MSQHDPNQPPTTPSLRVSRRNFLQAAGAGAAGAALATGGTVGAVPFSDSRAFAQGGWDQETDIVIVGSGAAALTAAVMAGEAGNDVLLLEKAGDPGGTTAKSGGGYWIPNNPAMQEMGLEDPRDDALKYMARYSYPKLYNPDDPQLGLPQNEYELIAAMYDYGSEAMERLAELDALQSTMFMLWNGEPAIDYMEHFPQNKAPRGRLLAPETPEGEQGGGGELVRQLQNGAESRGAEILTSHRVARLVVNEDGATVGVEALNSDGGTVAVQARKAVVFGSGGFTHDPWLVLHFQRGPMYGGCAVPTNEGDFVRIGEGVGSKLGNMTGAYHAQIVLEQALEFASVPSDVFFMYGDSSLQVNRFGHRVMNEKRNYNDRTQVHFNWDPTRGEWTNQLLFWVYDQRVADYWAGSYPIPAQGSEAPYVITGDTLADLGEAIDARLAELADQTGGVELDSSFNANFHDTVGRFNRFAEDGDDLDFLRGDFPYDREWGMSPPTGEGFQDVEWPSPDQPNITMHPLRSDGPYYAIILAAGTLTTNGGPVINAQGQILNSEDQPIPGLYGAGSCIASPSASAYWGGGGTLGPAITTGYIAGMNAAEEPIKEPTGAEAALGIPAGAGVEEMATPEGVDVEPGPGTEDTEEEATPTP